MLYLHCQSLFISIASVTVQTRSFVSVPFPSATLPRSLPGFFPVISHLMSVRNTVQTRTFPVPHPPSAPAPKRLHPFAHSPFQISLLGQAERLEEEAKHKKSKAIRIHRSTPRKRPNAHKELELLRDEVRSLELTKVTIAGALASMTSVHETAYSSAFREYKNKERQKQLNGTGSVRPTTEGIPLYNSEDRRLDNRVKLRRWMGLLAEQLSSMNNEQRTQLLTERIPEVLECLKVRSQSARAG